VSCAEHDLPLTKQPEGFILWTLRLCETLRASNISSNMRRQTTSQSRQSIRKSKQLSVFHTARICRLHRCEVISSRLTMLTRIRRRHRSTRSGKVFSPDTAPQTEYDANSFETAQSRPPRRLSLFRRGFEIASGAMCQWRSDLWDNFLAGFFPRRYLCA
jgi:hypothetical protein